MSKKKPVGEIIAGLLITGVGLYISYNAIVSRPSYIDALFISVPILIVGLIILVSKDATKAGKTIQDFFVRM